MNQTTVDPGGTVPLSTSLDPQAVPLESGGGRVAPGFVDDKGNTDKAPAAEPAKAEGPKKPVSVRETLESVKADLDKENGEDTDKAKAEAAAKDGGKADEPDKDKQPEKARDQSGKFTKAEDKPADKDAAPKAEQGAPDKAAAGQDGTERRQSEGRQHVEPPARFLPEARTKWANTPSEVKAEVHRVAQEYEGELAKAKEATERYEQLRQFDEIAKSNGRDLKDSLQKIAQIENALARNPVIGLELILREIGPRKNDGSPLSLHDVASVVAKLTPEQWAQNMQGAIPQQTQQAQKATVQGQQPALPSAVEQRIAALESEIVATKAMPIITAFAAKHTDYPALEGQIATILKSGVVDQIYGTGLTPEQRLEQAYRMAGGQGPASRSELQAGSPHSVVEDPRPVNPDAGTKSVRGAPNGGEEVVVDLPKKSIRELLHSEMQRLQAAG